MCGICGVVYGDGRLPIRSFKRANDLIAHRGPDDEGYHVDAPVGLAMRRLSIIDLNTGHQPISYANEALWIVLNGEIYNFKELRAGSRPRATGSRRSPTPRSSLRCTTTWAQSAWTSCAACSRSRCGIRASAVCSSPVTASVKSRYATRCVPTEPCCSARSFAVCSP